MSNIMDNRYDSERVKCMADVKIRYQIDRSVSTLKFEFYPSRLYGAIYIYNNSYIHNKWKEINHKITSCNEQ